MGSDERDMLAALPFTPLTPTEIEIIFHLCARHKAQKRFTLLLCLVHKEWNEARAGCEWMSFSSGFVLRWVKAQVWKQQKNINKQQREGKLAKKTFKAKTYTSLQVIRRKSPVVDSLVRKTEIARVIKVNNLLYGQIWKLVFAVALSFLDRLFVCFELFMVKKMKEKLLQKEAIKMINCRKS